MILTMSYLRMYKIQGLRNGMFQKTPRYFISSPNHEVSRSCHSVESLAISRISVPLWIMLYLLKIAWAREEFVCLEGEIIEFSVPELLHFAYFYIALRHGIFPIHREGGEKIYIMSLTDFPLYYIAADIR